MTSINRQHPFKMADKTKERRSTHFFFVTTTKLWVFFFLVIIGLDYFFSSFLIVNNREVWGRGEDRGGGNIPLQLCHRRSSRSRSSRRRRTAVRRVLFWRRPICGRITSGTDQVNSQAPVSFLTMAVLSFLHFLFIILILSKKFGPVWYVGPTGAGTTSN